ncbi:MAG: hypothetical protein QOF55_645 [Thermoleophilaceae bacterium]|nr:hypothetical protein [Thermoleophilaceae bacterium]
MTLVKLQDTLDNGKCASTRLFKDGLDAFGKALNAEPEIRFYVDGSPGMASAATTVHLLERLIDEFSF